MSRRLSLPLALLLAAPLVPSAAAAQDWEYQASIYGWFSGLDSSVGTQFGTLDTELSFSDVWDMLDMAFFGTFEARQGQLGFILDLNYTDLSTTKNTPFGVAFSSATVDTKLTIASGYSTWRISDTTAAAIDLAGGFRAYDLDLGITLAPGAAPGQSFSQGDSWFDAVIGARAIFPLGDRWTATVAGDVGGFGIGSSSDMSYNALVTVGYDINDTWSIKAGYRYLGFDKDLNGRDVSLDLSGPLLGVSARF
jgi:opacity protein-like surface antigen